MIKCSGYGKLLKQLFIISLISCFGLLGSSSVNAYEEIISSTYYWNIYDVNEEFTVPNDSVFSNKVLSSSAGVLQGGGMSVKPLILGNSRVSSSQAQFNSRFIFYWDLNNELNYLCNRGYSTTSGRYNLSHYNFDYFSRFSLTGFTSHSPSIASLNSYGEKITVDSFYNDSQLKGSMTRYALGINKSSSYLQSVICFVYDDLGFSICALGYCPSSISNQTYATNTSIPNGASIDPVEFSTDIIGTSPRTTNTPTPTPGGNNQVGNGGELEGVNYTIIDTGDIVYYFENNPSYNYDEGVCYVGTNDYSTLYSSGSTLGLFRANSGGTVFDLFSSQFGNSFTLNQVGMFINAWHINYDTWFKGGSRDENNRPMYNAYYSYGSGFYQDFSDNLIVPFIGNPIAFYFMGYVSTLYNNMSNGQAVSLYCYYKLGLDKDSGNMNITDDIDDVYWRNATDFINQRNKFYGLNSGNMIIQSQSWSGTILDYFTGTNEDNLDFNTFFSKSFNKFKDKFSTINIQALTGFGVLPIYIISFMLAIIFFRFISH